MAKTAVITGPSRGIGRAIATAMLETDEYDVYGIGRTDPRLAGVVHVPCDLVDAAATAHAAAGVLQAAGGVDALILNAGVGIFKPIDQLTIQEWQQVLNVGLTASFVLLNSMLPIMKTKNFGRIVLISSDADELTFADASAYCAAKMGLVGMAGCIRKEVNDYDIHVTIVSPGRVDTHFNGKSPGDRPRSLLPEHIARQVMFALAQPARCEIERIASNSALEKLLH